MTSNFSPDEIARRLALTDHRPVLSEPDFPIELLRGEPRSAAVLIPLFQKDGGWHITLIRRTADLTEHSGQVAFPGGRTDPDDISPEATALREAYEEIGILPQDVHILGRLAETLTITNFRVTPIVGLIPWPYSFHPAVEEVARIFTIPLDWLADPHHHEQRLRQLPAPYAPIKVAYFHPYDGEILWGVSARFMLELLKVINA